MNPPPPPPPPVPRQHSNQLPPPPLPYPPSLSTVLSDLSSLLHLSSAALLSLPIPTADTCSALLPCPFNPNHRLPPSSLFSHYLNCPTPLSLSHNFHYPLTLHSAASSITRFAPSAVASASDDLSISLESYMGFKAPSNSFFYQNCPGPVTPSTDPPLLLNLPRDLYVECADFDNGITFKNVRGFLVDSIRFLPSEVWAIRSEIESWGGGLPAAYSHRVLRAVLRLRDCKLLHLSEWIVSNSPRYGVVVDFAMRDHMVLLIMLCLKVVVKEAFELAGIICIGGELKTGESVLSALGDRSFECPALVKVMMWFALQVGILYGDVNGKFFSVEVLKECILDAASHASLFHSDQKGSEQNESEKVDDVQAPVKSIELTGDTKRDGENINDKTVGNSVIFICQVAAAVAALHERALIEEKIKFLRNSQPLPAYRRNVEHEYVSKIANEERKKRADYRPIIEHDGFLWQRSNNQDPNKVKSREELLAEERDYKRRRMSYRGKKLKRNPLEVMRDIIKEYTEEINQFGGTGDMETASLASDDSNVHVNATVVSGSRRHSKMPEVNRDKSLDYRRELSSRHYSDGLEDDIVHPRKDFDWDNVHKDFKTKVEQNRYSGNNYLGNKDGRQSSTYSREQVHGREKKVYDEAREGSPKRSAQRRSKSRERNNHKYRDEHERNYHKREREDRDKSFRKRESSEDNRKHGERGRKNAYCAFRDRHEDSEGHGDRKRSKKKWSRSSRPDLQEFDDRYDPGQSHG